MFSRLTIFCVLMLAGDVACVPVATRAPVNAAVAGAQSTSPPEPACGSLGPSTEPHSIARVGALFSRPENVSQLLQNLKLAYEKDLFIQSGFYDDENLMKFFAGAAVKWGGSRPLTGAKTSARDIVITSDTQVFPQLTIKMLRYCTPLYRHVSRDHNDVYSAAEGASLSLQVKAIPGFTVSAVRTVFGAETDIQIDYGVINDGVSGPMTSGITPTGQLIYNDEYAATHIETLVSTNEVTFVVTLDFDRTPTPRRVHDTNYIESILVRQIGR
jgi:hypothetical protein